MKRFEQATSRPHGYLVVDLKSSTQEHDRLRENIFESQARKRQHAYDSENEFSGESNLSDNTLNDDVDNDYEEEEEENESENENIGMKRKSFITGPPGKRIKEEIEEERARHDIWDRRFQKPLRQAHSEQFKERLNSYIDQEYSFDDALSRAANDVLPHLRKMLRQNYAQFLIDFYVLQKDPTQQQIFQSARKLRHQHGMNFKESIRQAIKLRKDLFEVLWPSHDINISNHENDKNDEVENA
jgi:hypothetical protein